MSVAERYAYDRFRTGLTFAAVRRMMWVDSPDRRLWRHKTRRCVLRFWRALKRAMWAVHLCGLDYETYAERCAAARDYLPF
jgi:hypothetical protein